MVNSIRVNNFLALPNLPQRHLLCGIIFVLLFNLTIFAQTQISTPDNKTLVIDDAPEMEVFAFGKTVIIKSRAKGVLAFGGDVIVEGRVEGDVATIGGSIVQKESSMIGGDVIIFGGTYQPESANPLRGAGKETIMYAGYEEELRSLAQNPEKLFSPDLSFSFFAQRVLSMLFWLILALAFNTIAPGAVSRSIARLQLSTLKIFAIGSTAFVLTTITIIASLSVLPNYLSAIFGLMAFALLLLAYVFGRVILQMSLGKTLVKQFVAEKYQSETLAIFLGVFIWTFVLSVPYLWTVALLALFAAGIGLITTALTTTGWQKL